MDTLSHRAQQFSSKTTQMIKNFLILQNNSFCEETNPNGICNCGVAENYLCENELISKLKTIDIWRTEHMFYPNSVGQRSLRDILCRTFERRFQLKTKLDPERMLISSGLSGIISLLGYLLADRNDVFLIASPYYTVFDHDISALANCQLWRCPLLDQDKGLFKLSVDIFQHGYEEALNEGRRPRGIILINPHNPTGDVYDEITLQPIMKFAAEKQLHLIFDEIYAFSLFTSTSNFESVLNYQTIIDPLRTHFVWSFSKDFALSGLRLGVLYAGSKDMCSIGAPINFLQIPSTIIQEILAKFLSDEKWIDDYIELNRSRLTQRYNEVRKRFEEFDQRISIRPSQSGFFIWADFRSLLHQITFDEENRFFQLLFDQGLYITPGSALACSQAGWFRMIFSVKSRWIDKAFERFRLALEIYRRGPTT